MKVFAKWLGTGFGVLVLLAVVLLVGLYVRGGAVMASIEAMPHEQVDLFPADPSTVAWGKHLVESHACQSCHGPKLEGRVVADAPPFLLVAGNLTTGTGGLAAEYSDADWERAIRHGINKDGRGMLVMPSDAFSYLSDRELSAMVAYLKTLPPVDNTLPGTTLKPLGRVIAGTGGIHSVTSLISSGEHRPAPPVAPTVAFGAYRSQVCQACHGGDYLGAPHPEPGAPYSPSLVSVKGWSEDQFLTAMRTGMRPSGTAMNAKYMPWPYMGQMTDDELKGVYAFLQTIPDGVVADAEPQTP